MVPLTEGKQGILNVYFHVVYKPALYCLPLCASGSSSPGLTGAKARLFCTYILDAAKQMPFLPGGDVIRGGQGTCGCSYSGSIRTAAGSRAMGGKGVCQLSLMDILHLQKWMGFSISHQPRLLSNTMNVLKFRFSRLQCL